MYELIGKHRQYRKTHKEMFKSNYLVLWVILLSETLANSKGFDKSTFVIELNNTKNAAVN